MDFGSKMLRNKLFCFGFSISYDEVVRHKQAVVASKNAEVMISSQTLGSFTQIAGDNADYNIANFKWNGIFHGMTLLTVTTNKSNHEIEWVVQRHPLTLGKRRIDFEERNSNKILQQSKPLSGLYNI